MAVGLYGKKAVFTNFTKPFLNTLPHIFPAFPESSKRNENDVELKVYGIANCNKDLHSSVL